MQWPERQTLPVGQPASELHRRPAMAFPGKARKLPTAAAAVNAAPPSRPRNCRRDTFVAACSAILLNFANIGHLVSVKRELDWTSSSAIHATRSGVPAPATSESFEHTHSPFVST